MDEKIITIRCFDKCRYDLYWPAWFLKKPVYDVRKIFIYLWRFDLYKGNDEVIQTLKTEFPVLIEALEKVWGERSAEFSQGFKDPDPTYFPYNWTKSQKRAESTKRKKDNAALFSKVKKAKAEYDKAVKLFELFKEAKNKIYGDEENV